jgi:hypothetical protein
MAQTPMVERKKGKFHKVTLFIKWWFSIPSFQLKSLQMPHWQGFTVTTSQMKKNTRNPK